MSSGRVGVGVGQQQIGANQSSGVGGLFGSGSSTSGQTGSSTAGGMMSGIMGSMMGGSNAQAQQNRPQHKGIPAVIPTGISPQSQQPQQQQQQQQQAGPNLMQKLTDMTAPGGDILSKGKELIFMKFGLGGK